MKHHITHLLLFLLIPLCAISQNGHFEGVIHYKFKWEATDPGIYLKSYKSFFGTASVVYIQPGRYKQVYLNTKGLEFVQYDYRINFYYFKLFGKDTIFYNDCIENKINYRLAKTGFEKKVLGYQCKQLLVIGDNDVSEYYYTEALPVDPAYYTNHKMAAYDQITEQTRSVYLMNVSSFKGIKITTIARHISQKKLEDKIFELPDFPLKKKD
ncbi:MAG: hypothetical protein WCL06_12345 [Bacteroidota bacterium]